MLRPLIAVLLLVVLVSMLLQKELSSIINDSKICASERDTLREGKKAWMKAEVDLRDTVKRLEETCSEMEKAKTALESKLQDREASA